MAYATAVSKGMNENFKFTDQKELANGKSFDVSGVKVILQASPDDSSSTNFATKIRYPQAVDTPPESNAVITLAEQLSGLEVEGTSLTVKQEKKNGEKSVDIEVKIGDVTLSIENVDNADKTFVQILQRYVDKKSKDNKVTLNPESLALIKTATDAKNILHVQIPPPINTISIDSVPENATKLAEMLGLLKGAIDKSQVGASRAFKVVEAGNAVSSDKEGNILIPKILLTAQNGGAEVIGKQIATVDTTAATKAPANDKASVPTPAGSLAAGKVDQWERFFVMQGKAFDETAKAAVANGSLDEKEIKALGLDKSVDKMIADLDEKVGISVEDLTKFEENLKTFADAVGLKDIEEARKIYANHTGAFEKRSVEDLKAGGLAALGLADGANPDDISKSAEAFVQQFKPGSPQDEYLKFLSNTPEFKDYKTNIDALEKLAQRMAALALVADLSEDAQKDYLKAIGVDDKDQSKYILRNHLEKGKEKDAEALKKFWQGEGVAEGKAADSASSEAVTQGASTKGAQKAVTQGEQHAVVKNALLKFRKRATELQVTAQLHDNSDALAAANLSLEKVNNADKAINDLGNATMADWSVLKVAANTALLAAQTADIAVAQYMSQMLPPASPDSPKKPDKVQEKAPPPPKVKPAVQPPAQPEGQVATPPLAAAQAAYTASVNNEGELVISGFTGTPSELLHEGVTVIFNDNTGQACTNFDIVNGVWFVCKDVIDVSNVKSIAIGNSLIPFG